MTEIFQHDKCALVGDKTEIPRHGREQSCQRCGVYGRVYLYSSQDVSELVANFEGDMVGEMAESIPLVKTEPMKEVPTLPDVEEAVEEVNEPLQEEDPEETAVEEAVEPIEEEAVVESLETEVAETNQTMTADEKEIADLKARLEELEK